jgi:hypothetical protein
MIIATRNMRGVNQMMVEIINELKRRKTEALVISETKNKSNGKKFLLK